MYNNTTNKLIEVLTHEIPKLESGTQIIAYTISIDGVVIHDYPESDEVYYLGEL